MWQVVSDIGVLHVIAGCKPRHRTARETPGPLGATGVPGRSAKPLAAKVYTSNLVSAEKMETVGIEPTSAVA
jgi:hypothetical protein